MISDVSDHEPCTASYFGELAASVTIPTLFLTRQKTLNLPNVEHRPIRSERLFFWLQSLEARLIPMGLPIDPILAKDTILFGAVEADRYRLLRWPSAEIHEQNPDRLRIAALLLRRPMNVVRISEVCGLSTDSCISFLSQLHSHGFLEIDRASAQTELVSSAVNGSYVIRTKQLISALRKRLGL